MITWISWQCSVAISWDYQADISVVLIIIIDLSFICGQGAPAVNNVCLCLDVFQVDGSKGCVIVAEMSSDRCLANDDYTQSR